MEHIRKRKTENFVVHSMKDISEKAMEVNNELRVNVDEQQDDKTFKLKSDIDDSDEVQEISAARTPIEK